MKNSFDWYFQPSAEEMDEIWRSGILTVDTNVLLDLYRYHESTRDSLISSLQNFEGAKWLSHQACEEFFRNRTKVIISSNQTFKQAQDEIEKLNKSLDSAASQLKGNRIIPSDISEKLRNAVSEAVKEALFNVQAAKENYPKYLKDDPILTKLTELFENAIGEKVADEELQKIRAEAEYRIQNKTPPGYMDDDKEDERPYGDYFLWRQILERAKAERKPIILVTSERKEDWWEKISGITTGPRIEMIKEARDFSGQRVLIYQTERFLEYALQRFNQPVNPIAIEEIRAISASRSAFEAAVILNSQDIGECSDAHNKGSLTLELTRPVKNFTVSGHFDPRMQSAPSVKARLTQAPENIPSHRLRAGTGTTYDFNVHIKCEEQGEFLPAGSYTFEYEAACNIPDTNNNPALATEVN